MKKAISIKWIITLVFVLAMLLTTVGIGFLLLTSWLSSAEETAERITADLGENIYQQISSFLHLPDQINAANQKIIESGILNLNDEKELDRFFVGVLSSLNEEIYSFSLGTVRGEYYGARRNEKGVIEVMRSNQRTGGNSWYYSVNEDLTAGSLVMKAGLFDPRTRPWYQEAVKAGGPTFSPVYKHFIMDDLTVSCSKPIYIRGELQGVLGIHLLLSRIGTYLEETIRNYNGYALIIEKDTGALIANSLGLANYSSREGSLKRTLISEIDIQSISGIYEQYSGNPQPHFIYKSTEELHVNVQEIKLAGLDWLIISAIPRSLYLARVHKSMRNISLFALLALALSLFSYYLITRRLLRPMKQLYDVSAALSAGDLDRRATVYREDELGGISRCLNMVADKMQFLVDNLEANVRARTEELVANKNQLQLILDSTAEAIYGIDLNGNCTFCNRSCLKLLGYNSQEDLLGKNMHHQIHHSRRDGTPFPIDECRILRSLKEGHGFTAEDEVFWRAGGTYFEVEYNAHPQVCDGQVVGAVITFMDITDRKRREEKIKYLSYHDQLTGLYNRRSLEEKGAELEARLPLSIIFADINGLKMTNDIFGHAAGDQLIRKSAEILLNACREEDFVARVGGDEFVILLPETDREMAEEIIARIRDGFANARVAAIKCSISLGSDTKVDATQSLEEIMTNAENAMYKDKTMNRRSINTEIIDSIIETLHARNLKEKRHSSAVRDLSGKLGAALSLSEPEISTLMRAGYLHDIGKITLNESLLTKESLTSEELEKVRQHSVIGYRILNLFDDTLDLAEYVYSHHEKWDGTGYPRGLKGQQIPLISRIISVVETYDRVFSRGEQPEAERKEAALAVIREGSGKQFDPEIAAAFLEMMST